MMARHSKDIVVVGGGYLGAMTALLFSQNSDFKITVIEKQERLCGLYNTAWESHNRFFDFGSRAILQTGVTALDDLLFSILPDEEYPKTTDNLKEFSFQNNSFCGHSNCLDARTLPDDIFAQGKAEMLAIDGTKLEGREFTNLEELCLATYGQIFTRSLIQPAIEKLTGVSITNLDTSSLAIHGLHRIIISDQDEAKSLKQESSFNGNRIAFARYDDNKSTMLKTYPKSAGLSDYGERIKRYLNNADNVDLITNDSVIELIEKNGIVQKASLESGKSINCDDLIWTIPSIFFAKMQGIDMSSIKPPIFRNSVLAHFVIKGDVKTDAYFVYNYDPNYLTYRGTFYDNFSSTPDDLKSVTIEIFHDALEPDLDAIKRQVFDELITSKCISDDSSIVDSHIHFHRGSWPNFACGFFESQAQANQKAKGNFQNVHFLGKANGKHHSTSLVYSANELYQTMLG